MLSAPLLSSAVSNHNSCRHSRPTSPRLLMMMSPASPSPPNAASVVPSPSEYFRTVVSMYGTTRRRGVGGVVVLAGEPPIDLAAVSFDNVGERCSLGHPPAHGSPFAVKMFVCGVMRYRACVPVMYVCVPIIYSTQQNSAFRHQPIRGGGFGWLSRPGGFPGWRYPLQVTLHVNAASAAWGRDPNGSAGEGPPGN